MDSSNLANMPVNVGTDASNTMRQSPNDTKSLTPIIVENATSQNQTITATPVSTATSIASDQHLLLEIIFFLCTILDTIIVQPILFITSDDNVISLPFYLN